MLQHGSLEHTASVNGILLTWMWLRRHSGGKRGGNRSPHVHVPWVDCRELCTRRWRWFVVVCTRVCNIATQPVSKTLLHRPQGFSQKAHCDKASVDFKTSHRKHTVIKQVWILRLHTESKPWQNKCWCEHCKEKGVSVKTNSDKTCRCENSQNSKHWCKNKQ